MDAVIHEDNNNNMDNMDDDHQRDNSDANNNTDTADDDDITDLIYILQHRRDFPVQQRERTILDLARNFHTELIDDTHTRITDQTSGDEILGALVLFFLKPRENRRLTRRNSNTQHAPHCSNSNSTMDAVSHVSNDTDRNNNADTSDEDDNSVVDTRFVRIFETTLGHSLRRKTIASIVWRGVSHLSFCLRIVACTLRLCRARSRWRLQAALC